MKISGIVIAVVVLLAANQKTHAQQEEQEKAPLETTSGPDVAKGCVTYVDENFRGDTATVLPGEDDEDSGNVISSIACHSGCTLTGYDDTDFHGEMKTWSGSTAYVGDSWDDKIESLKVECSAAGGQQKIDGPAPTAPSGPSTSSPSPETAPTVVQPTPGPTSPPAPNP
jgi:hypothetical protein